MKQANSLRVFEDHTLGDVDSENLRFSRVLFLMPPTGTYCREDRCQSFFDFHLVPTARAPLEECEAAGAIRAVGATALVIDAPTAQLTPEQTIVRVSDFKPDLLVIVSTFGTLDADLAWASRLKAKSPTLTIGLRGAPCYVFPDDILNRSADVDFCIRGEYELVFESLCKNGIDNTPGIVTKQTTSTAAGAPLYEQNLDGLPFPDRSTINQSLYRARIVGAPQATVRVQRGCPYPCTYCLVHTVNGDVARHRSPESLVQEIKEIQSMGTNYLYLRADTFTLDRRWAMALAKALQENCPGVRWVTTTRAERVDDELLCELKKAGCYGLSFGIDVASEEIGKKVQKKVNLKAAERAMRLCDTHGIISLAYLMIGFLWETEKTLQETAAFAKAMRPDLLTIHFAHPYPGTPYFEEYKQSGTEVTSLRAQAEPALNTRRISTDRLSACAKKMLRQHYSRPAVLYSVSKKVAPLLLSRLSKRSPL